MTEEGLNEVSADWPAALAVCFPDVLDQVQSCADDLGSNEEIADALV